MYIECKSHRVRRKTEREREREFGPVYVVHALDKIKLALIK